MTVWNQYPASQNPPSDFVEKDYEKRTVGMGLYQEPSIILYWVRRPGEERFRRNAKTEIRKAQKAYDEAMAPAWKAYSDAMYPAWKAYNEAVAPARKAYDEAMAPARKAHEEAVAQAYSEAVAAPRKAHKETMAAAWKAYTEAVAVEWKAYDEAVAAARKVRYEAVIVTQEILEFASIQYAFEPPSVKYIVYREDEARWAETEDPDEARNLVRSALAEIRGERESLKQKVTRTREWAAKGVKVARFDPSKVFVNRRHPVRVRGHRRRA